MGSVSLEKRPQRALSVLLPHEGTGVKKKAVCEPGSEPSPDIGSAGTLILDFAASGAMRINFFIVVCKPASLQYFVIMARLD